MDEKVTIFLMDNNGEFKFTKVKPYYEDIIKLLGLDFDEYMNEDIIRIDDLPYTIYSKMFNRTPGSRVTAMNTKENTFMLDSFILIRENKNGCFFNMSTNNINSIKSHLIVTQGKVRLLAQEYQKNKIILKFD